MELGNDTSFPTELTKIHFWESDPEDETRVFSFSLNCIPSPFYYLFWNKVSFSCSSGTQTWDQRTYVTTPSLKYIFFGGNESGTITGKKKNSTCTMALVSFLLQHVCVKPISRGNSLPIKKLELRSSLLCACWGFVLYFAGIFRGQGLGRNILIGYISDLWRKN